MMLLYSLITLLALIAIAAWPAWPYSRRWGYSPAVGTALIVLMLIALIHFDVI
jgi:uncharacterized membrane protein YqjE